MNCCENPMIRIANASGRVFCANCRTYLDARPQSASEPLRDEEPGDAGERAADEEEDVDDAPAD